MLAFVPIIGFKVDWDLGMTVEIGSVHDCNVGMRPLILKHGMCPLPMWWSFAITVYPQSPFQRSQFILSHRFISRITAYPQSPFQRTPCSLSHSVFHKLTAFSAATGSGCDSFIFPQSSTRNQSRWRNLSSVNVKSSGWPLRVSSAGWRSQSSLERLFAASPAIWMKYANNRDSD